MKDKDIKNWRNLETDITDDLHVHFDKSGLIEWTDISEEGRRIYSLMFEKIETFSPIDGVIAAVAAQAAKGAFEAVARALGVDGQDLAYAVWDWEHGDRNDAIGWDGLQKEIEKGRAFHKSLSDGD